MAAGHPHRGDAPNASPPSCHFSPTAAPYPAVTLPHSKPKRENVMKSSLGLKLGAIGLLSIVLLVGLLWIGSIVRERQMRRDAVVQEIADSSSGAQRLEGPILVVPYEKTVKEWKEDAGSGNRHTEERQIHGQMLILPEVFRVEGAVPTELRRRGIYEARLYHASLRIQASFQIQPHYGVADFAAYHFEQPSIALGITDIRGIENASKVLLNG